MADTNDTQSPGPMQDVHNDVQTARFIQVLRQAMVRNRLSERRLATELGLTIGTTQKYFRQRVHPLRVATSVSRELARLLGVTVDALLAFYETGEFRNDLKLEEVASWLRSDAGVQHLAPMLEAMSDLGRRLVTCETGGTPKVGPPPPPRYEWPLEELESAQVSRALRERMGLSDEVLERLATTGEFDDDLVEAFSVATNLEEAAVREAFLTRTAVTG